MAKKYLDNNGLLYFWQKIKTMFALVTHTHTKSQITDFPTSMTPSSHTHGNITNEGALQSTDVAIASGDKLVVTDSSNSNKVARTGTSFDGSTTTKALTQKGTFETFLQEHQDISGKVDKVDGKGLSTNDYTTAEKTKLAGIASGAEANVQSDWNQTDTGADDYIKNKPTIDSALSSTSENAVQNKVINTALNGKANGNGRIFFGTCSTAGATAAKVVTCPSYDALTEGDLLVVLFSNDNRAVNPTLNVNSKGDKAIKVVTYTGSVGGDWDVIQANYLEEGVPLLFMYCNGNWVAMIDSYKRYTTATTSVAGLMSTTDKGKVDKLLFDSNNLIDSSILPSYVDDVIEAYPRSGATELSSTWLSTSSGGSALTPETGKIYVLMAASTSYEANTQFRWSGTTYVKLSDGGVSEITNSEIDTIVAS